MFKRHGLSAARERSDPEEKQEKQRKVKHVAAGAASSTVTHSSSAHARWGFVRSVLTLDAALPFTAPSLRNWQTVRLYISSTFLNFFAEREMLVKDTMPMLRFWAEKSKIRLVDLDLRWGLPRDSRSEESIQSILDAIQRYICRIQRFEESHMK